jgi:hypothetical protein
VELIVLKYLALAGITYGTYAYLAGAQILLCVYLVTNGLVLVSSKERLEKRLDKGGKIKYDSGLGPYGLSPEELEKEISIYLHKELKPLLTTGLAEQFSHNS